MDEFADLKKKLSRLPLKDRIDLSGFLSFVSINSISGFKRRNTPPRILPWDAESFATVALTVEKQSAIRKEGFGKEAWSYFVYALSLFEKHALPKNYRLRRKRFGIDGLIGPVFMQQIAAQQRTIITTYRYHRLFSWDGFTRNRFSEKINGGDYSFFFVLANLLSAFKTALENEGLAPIDQYRRFEELMGAVIQGKENYLNALSVDIEDLRRLQEEKASLDVVSDTYYSYKVLNEKPFLQVGGTYHLVCPSSLPFACTDALFISLTYHDDVFKDHLASIAFEDYVNELARETGLYLMVPKEKQRKKYFKRKNELGPADVVLMRDGTIVFIELKARTYIRKSWMYDEGSIQIELDHTVTWIKKMLNRLCDFRDGHYKPFGETPLKIDRCFLVLGTLLYLPIDRSVLIQKVVEDSKYKEFEEFLKTSFVRTDIYSIETYWLYKKDPIQEWISLAEKERLGDFGPIKAVLYASERLASFSSFHKLVEREAKKACGLSKKR